MVNGLRRTIDLLLAASLRPLSVPQVGWASDIGQSVHSRGPIASLILGHGRQSGVLLLVPPAVQHSHSENTKSRCSVAQIGSKNPTKRQRVGCQVLLATVTKAQHEGKRPSDCHLTPHPLASFAKALLVEPAPKQFAPQGIVLARQLAINGGWLATALGRNTTLVRQSWFVLLFSAAVLCAASHCSLRQLIHYDTERG